MKPNMTNFCSARILHACIAKCVCSIRKLQCPITHQQLYLFVQDKLQPALHRRIPPGSAGIRKCQFLRMPWSCFYHSNLCPMQGSDTMLTFLKLQSWELVLSSSVLLKNKLLLELFSVLILLGRPGPLWNCLVPWKNNLQIRTGTKLLLNCERLYPCHLSWH